MPNLQQGDKLLVTVNYLQASQILMNTQVLNYNTDIGGPDDYQAFAAAWVSDAVAIGGLCDQIAGLTVSALTIVNVSMQLVYPTRLRGVKATTGVYTRFAGAPVPVNTAGVVQKVSLVAKRYGTGSWHQPGLPLSKLSADGGSLDATHMASLTAAIVSGFPQGYIPTGMNGNVDPVLWSPKVPARTTLIEGWVGKTSARTMHRRTLSVGK